MMSSFAKPFPLEWLRNMSGQPLFLPFWHVVSDYTPAHLKYLYPVRSVSQFKADLDYLLCHFEPISLETLTHHTLNEVPFSRPVFHATFDDGLRACSEVIAPILLEKGISATFFINPTFVDNRALMFRYKASLLANAGLTEALGKKHHDDWELDKMAVSIGLSFDDYLEKEKPYMSLQEIKWLKQQGFTIGAHSMDHPLFSEISPEKQAAQIQESCEWVGSHLEQEHTPFAFPFTDDGASRPEISHQALSFGTAGLKKDTWPRHLQRYPMESEANASAAELVKTEFLYYLLKAPLGRNIIRR